MNSRPTILALSILAVLAVPAGVLQAAVAQDVTEEDVLAQSIIDRTFQEIEQEGDRKSTRLNSSHLH